MTQSHVVSCTASKMEDDEGEIINLSAGVVAIIALRLRKRRRRLRHVGGVSGLIADCVLAVRKRFSTTYD